MKVSKAQLVIALVCLIISFSRFNKVQAAQMPKGKEYTNSVGMKFVRIKPGTFRMGQLKTLVPEVLPVIEGGDRGGRFDLLAEGDYDERPVHTVKITKPFYMGIREVTNKQYELFDPEHKKLRGKYSLSNADDEAVIFVSWYDAQAFCQWLSDQEGLPYRLPTEAEWEYACRAGTKTNYYAGDILPKDFHKKAGRVRISRQVSLQVGKTTPNIWGLYDMHGNVEEWCHDWYGLYVKKTQKNPVGYASGNFRVTRGGSHSTYPYFLRSANRSGTLPEDKHWLIGFRVVIGKMPKSKPLPVPRAPRNQRKVIKRDQSKVFKGPDADKPYFKGPRKFVKIPRD
ncbi:MAG: formylglycine-generating enzyme family protein, partial [Planctomycetota bacterium]